MTYTINIGVKPKSKLINNFLKTLVREVPASPRAAQDKTILRDGGLVDVHETVSGLRMTGFLDATIANEWYHGLLEAAWKLNVENDVSIVLRVAQGSDI